MEKKKEKKLNRLKKLHKAADYTGSEMLSL